MEETNFGKVDAADQVSRSNEWLVLRVETCESVLCYQYDVHEAV